MSETFGAKNDTQVMDTNGAAKKAEFFPNK
jgi:hypothetical protein